MLWYKNIILLYLACLKISITGGFKIYDILSIEKENQKIYEN